MITFPKQYVRVNKKYTCKCGHKFQRANSDWFTNNPFNPKSDSECRQDIIKAQSKKIRKCPKCKSDCKPNKN